MTFKQLILTVLSIHASITDVKGIDLTISPEKFSVVSSPQLKVKWSSMKSFSSYEINWDQVNYSSQQVTYKEVGRRKLSSETQNYIIESGLFYNKQYRVCLSATQENCMETESSCHLIQIPKVSKTKTEYNVVYLDIGPIHNKNLSLHWNYLTQERINFPKSIPGFKISWRRIDGRIDHPGHSTNSVSSMHTITGLRPDTRYEICVGERIAGKEGVSCTNIKTAEGIPGPPTAEIASCSSQAHGTHWKCSITWFSPNEPNGKIIRYSIDWRDQEGYDLMESNPSGALCDPICNYQQILTFHPYKVCVKASTDVGEGWESCVPVHDIPTRIKAFFELKIVIIIIVTILIYQLGPQLLKVLLQCCIRGLYRQMEGEKKHPV